MVSSDAIRLVSKFFGWSLLVASVIVFIGWLTNENGFKSLFIGSDPVNYISSGCFVLVAVIILIHQHSKRYRNFSVALSWLILLISTLRIFNFSIWNASLPMSTFSAFLFALISAALLLEFYQKYSLQEVALMAGLIGCMFLLTGYLFDVPEFQTSQPHFPALPTCILFFWTFSAIILWQYDRGLLSLLIGPLEGAKIGRFLIPLIFIIPYTIGYLRLLAIQSGSQSTEMVIAFFILFYTIIFATILFLVVNYLNKRDQSKKLYVEKINHLNQELNESVNQQLALNEELSAANEELTAMNDQLSLAMKQIQDQNLIILQQKEDALKKSQEYLDIIFSNTEEKIVLLDTNGRLIAFNRSLETFILNAKGILPKIGMYVWDMTLPERSKESKRAFQSALRGEKVSDEVRLTIFGEEVVHQTKYEPVLINGIVSYVSLISNDITKLNRSHEALKKNFIELQKVNYELDRFVYSASHDLRAPLSSILGLITVAKMENPGTQIPYLQTIEDRINHLDSFIKDILDYSRNARAEINYQKINFQLLINESNTALKLVSKYEKLAIEINIHEESEFYSDTLRLSIIFNNLISNAFKFRDPQKGDCYLSIRITVTPTLAQIQFIDNGIGIAKEHLSRIFDMFYRGTDRSNGSGIGLYIVKETIEKLGGAITVESVLDQYTTFDISIPNKLTDPTASIALDTLSKKSVEQSK